ncbi:MAG: cation-translocating P-type ATPase [Spirochaetia bacterium]|nr:cation-translocating P-type ATPase [Spirochaetia bacterium]
MNWHNLSSDEVLHILNVNNKRGLNLDQISQRKKQYGENELTEEKSKSLLRRFFHQFKDITIIILIIAAFVSLVIALIEKEATDFAEPVLILVIVILNAVMGLVQEQKAQKALDALKQLSSPHVMVKRDNREFLIESHEIVPGDIFFFEAGTLIPCDARLIMCESVLVDESPLTGESVPVEKDEHLIIEATAPLGDRKNMVYSGCAVVHGRGTAVATQIGMHTEIGLIASLLHSTKETKTPLQHTLSSLGKVLAFSAILTVIVIFIIGSMNKIPFTEMLMIAVSLAVSAIPEGLPAIVTIVLSLGVVRMAKKNAIIRNLSAVETLGRASIICSDKTGTLTQNKMSVTTLYIDGDKELSLSEEVEGEKGLQLLKFATLCCDATVSIDQDILKTYGDPTEIAIVMACFKKGIYKKDLEKKYNRVGEIPFDSRRKLMSTIHTDGDKKLVIVKGALDSLLPRLIEGDSEKALTFNTLMGSKALRVLAVAYRYIEEEIEYDSEHIETELHFLGLIGMIDPPRKEVFDAVATCKSAGIRPVMITGDHLVTAKAIASELKILEGGATVLTGEDLKKLDDVDLTKKVTEVSVYARVSPEDKIRIIRAWQRNNHIVAMTGDGVNDAPALKSADIGCAMGISGTDVAKQASDMTLSDDNFATIVEAIKEGRVMYDNIKKAVFFLIGTNIGELIAVFAAMLLFHVSPFISLQLLMINLVTDSFPAVALGMEKGDDDVMRRTPLKKGESLFAHHGALKVIAMGIMFALLTLVAFTIGRSVSLSHGRTMAFFVLSISQVFHAFPMRSHSSLFSIGPFSNSSLNKAALTSLSIIAIITFISPLTRAFGMIRLPVSYYFIALALASIPLFVMEMSKVIVKNMGKS